MDINQIIELWGSLSPRLARAIPNQKPIRADSTDEKRSDVDKKDETVDSIESRPEQDNTI